MFSATKSFFTNEATGGGGGPTPSWTLDFSTGTPSGYTLTRASSGTFVDSSGYIASASTDIARLTHNSSGSRLGLLVEEQRTNLFQRSAEFDNAFWAKEAAAVTANSVTSPENTTTADTLADNSTSGRHIIYNSRSGDLSLTRTLSVFAKKNSLNYLALSVTNSADAHCYSAIFDLDSGTVSGTKTNGNATLTSKIESYGNGWYRCSISGTMTTGTASFFPMIGTSDRSGFTGTLVQNNMPSYVGAGQSIYIWGAQLEAAATASAYIPTTTASVTRSADLVHVLDSSITSWGDPGALVVHFYPPGQAGTILSTDDASTAQVGIEASTTTAARAFWSSGSTSTGTIGTGVQKAVHYWTGSTSKFCINGGTVQSGTNNFTIANADFVTLGAEATESAGVPGTFSQYANCVIRKVEFYSGTLTDGNLQTITT